MTDQTVWADSLPKIIIFNNYLSIPELEQVFSGFPMGVEFQHFKSGYDTFTNIFMKETDWYLCSFSSLSSKLVDCK